MDTLFQDAIDELGGGGMHASFKNYLLNSNQTTLSYERQQNYEEYLKKGYIAVGIAGFILINTTESNI